MPDQRRVRPHRTLRWRAGLALEQPARMVAVATLGLAVAYVVGFTLWTAWISFTDSTLLPTHNFVGVKHYERMLALYRRHLS